VIFVDTSFWVALRNRRDRHHEEARILISGADLPAMLTSNHVIGETWTFLRRRAGHGSAVDFLELIERSERLVVEHVTQQLEGQALSWLPGILVCRCHQLPGHVDIKNQLGLGIRR